MFISWKQYPALVLKGMKVLQAIKLMDANIKNPKTAGGNTCLICLKQKEKEQQQF